jgi:hypothetical protein
MHHSVCVWAFFLCLSMCLQRGVMCEKRPKCCAQDATLVKGILLVSLNATLLFLNTCTLLLCMCAGTHQSHEKVEFCVVMSSTNMRAAFFESAQCLCMTHRNSPPQTSMSWENQDEEKTHGETNKPLGMQKRSCLGVLPQHQG